MGGGDGLPGGADQKTFPRCAVALRRVTLRLLRCMTACCDCCLNCFDVVIRIVGPVFIALAISIISFVSYTFFTVIFPYHVEVGWHPILLFNEFILSCFLVVNLLYNYAMSICTPAGLPPAYQDSVDDACEQGDAPVKPKRCSKCDRLKPARTHHCSVCKRCVMKMDHHCPWINNCVGWNNYRYFCLFMLYLALSCLFVAISGYSLFYQSLFYSRRRRTHHLQWFDMQCVSFSWLIAASIFAALCCLGGFHLYLVVTNQTTIEFHGNSRRKAEAKRRGEKWRNPYDLGCSRNFEQVFGPNKFRHFIWMLPYVAKRPTGDGMYFPTVCSMET